MNLKTAGAVLALTIFLGYGFLNGLDSSQLLNLQSLMIVFGGIGLVLWFGFPTEDIGKTWTSVIRAFSNTPAKDEYHKLMADVLKLARAYRMHGPMALEKTVKHVKNDFLAYGASLVAEGYSKADLYQALEREHRIQSAEDLSQIRILRTLTRLSPALGMAGTVISLMKVMQELGDTDSIGGSLGLALSSTLYGIMMANLLFLPLTLKLEKLAEENSARRMMITEAVMGIHHGEHPLRIAERLNSFDIYCKLNHKKSIRALASKGREKPLQQVSAG